jgi:hypothetical protein
MASSPAVADTHTFERRFERPHRRGMKLAEFAPGLAAVKTVDRQMLAGDG